MPGLGSSYAIAVNEDIRRRFREFMEAGEFCEGHLFAYIGAAAAYTHGEEWLEQVLGYVQANIDFTENYLKEHVPGIGMIRPQASYLVFWIVGHWACRKRSWQVCLQKSSSGPE